MPHQIMDDKRALGRKKFWHNLNDVAECTALEGLDRIGDFDVRLVRPEVIDPFSGQVLEHGNYMVVRSPMPDNPKEKHGVILGRPVSERFHVITPRMAATGFTEAVLHPDGSPVKVEAMGYLGNGDRMWITAQMDTFDVRVPGTSTAIPVENYILFWNPLSPDAAAYVLNVNLVVVCWNTAQMALNSARTEIAVPHTADAYERLKWALSGVYNNSLKSIDESKEVAQTLVSETITERQLAAMCEEIFPLPGSPKKNIIAKTSYDERLERWLQRCEIKRNCRAAVMDLFRGAGAGIQLPGVGGTKWAAYMAFTDLASHMNGHADAALMDFVEGDRGNIITKSREMLLALT